MLTTMMTINRVTLVALKLAISIIFIEKMEQIKVWVMIKIHMEPTKVRVISKHSLVSLVRPMERITKLTLTTQATISLQII